MNQTRIPAQIVQGHQVASGLNQNPRFPGGTLQMQMPYFRDLGLDLSVFYPGTVNLSIAPYHYRVLQPKLTFRNVKWHPIEPAEDFSFFDVTLLHRDQSFEGLVYYPHPETKPEHFQPPDSLELLLPFVQGLSYSERIEIQVTKEQMQFEL